jgi:hypothetical protein
MKIQKPVRSRKPRLTAMGIRCSYHATLSIRKKLALTSPTSGGRSVVIVRLRTKSHGVFFKNLGHWTKEFLISEKKKTEVL